jgi:endoglycosylceramidase
VHKVQSNVAGDVLANPLLLVPGVADKENLQTLWLNTTAAIRRSESPTNRKIVFVESVTWDDFIPVGFSELPSTTQNLGALSYHYYDLPNFNADWQLLSRTGDARRLNAGAMLTEFDFGNSNLTGKFAPP